MKKEIPIPETGYYADEEGNIYGRRGKILKPEISNRGYKRVTILNTHYLVHRLIGITFIENPNNYETINHIDGDKKNSNMSNLEWCSLSENIRHGFRTGLIVPKKGEDCNLSKLKETEVIKIRELFSTGKYTQKELGELFNISRSNIYYLIKGLSWKEVV